MLRMQPARRQHRDRVDILARTEAVDVIMGRHAELRGDDIGASTLTGSQTATSFAPSI
jgi:hypothetical protein